jgi:hypothetical protein
MVLMNDLETWCLVAATFPNGMIFDEESGD